jgi:hypothetical protein
MCQKRGVRGEASDTAAGVLQDDDVELASAGGWCPSDLTDAT